MAKSGRGSGSWQGDWVVTGGQSELMTPEQRPKVRSSAFLPGGPGLAGKFPPEAFSWCFKPQSLGDAETLCVPVEAAGSPRDCSRKGAGQEACAVGKLPGPHFSFLFLTTVKDFPMVTFE